MKSLFAFLLLSFLAVSQLAAQNSSLVGRIIDAKTGASLPGVNVIATFVADSTLQVGEASNADGRFNIVIRRQGAYRVKLSFIGYLPHFERCSDRRCAHGFRFVRNEIRHHVAR